MANFVSHSRTSMWYRAPRSQTGRFKVNALNRSTAEHRAGVRRSGRRGVIRLAALMALLTLGASASPALGSTASPGQLYAFGRNYYGQLGNETNLNGEPNF